MAANGKKVEPNRPTKIDVMGRMYVVRWLDELDWAQQPGDQEDLRGSTDHVSDTISMRTFDNRTDGDPASVGALQETMLHEVVHACTLSSAIQHNFYVTKDMEDHDAEEWLAVNLSPVLLYVLTHNPMLMTWLCWSDL